MDWMQRRMSSVLNICRQYISLIVIITIWLAQRVNRVEICAVSSLIFTFSSWTGGGVLIPMITNGFLYLSIMQNFSFIEGCFIFLSIKGCQRSLLKENKSVTITLVIEFIIFLIFARCTLRQAAFLIAAAMASVADALLSKQKMEPIHINFGMPLICLSLGIQLFSRTRVTLLPLVLISCLPTKAMSIKMPKLTYTKEAKRLLYFLAINFIFMFAEFWVGYSTNSLGLLADAFHMLCDNTSLFCSAFAALASQQEPTKTFPFGLSRVEIVCSFINAILLLFISFNLCSEAISRLIEQPAVGDENLLLVSVLGLIVNLGGLCCTGSSDGSVFLKSIFLHVMVDTCGSLAVIISAFCISKWNLYIADPICSLLIAISIFFTAIPLVRSVASSLMLESPRSREIASALANIVKVKKLNVWMCTETDSVATGSVSPYNANTDRSELLNRLSEVSTHFGIADCTFEVDKI